MARITAIFLLALVGLTATLNGAKMMLNPQTGGIGLEVQWLEHSPFTDYLIPGIILFSVIGLGFLLSAGLSIGKSRAYPTFITLSGLALDIWIITEMAMLRRQHFLQYVMLGVGLVLLCVGIAEQRKYKTAPEQR